jgi:16S rRNA (adenine1518-N6/adenine1519-N6)-dimethyltransferase
MSHGRDPDALLSRAGVRGDPNQDQHFLVDDRVLDRLPTHAEEFDTTHVLEVGAGTGALTDRLLENAERVTAIERDSRLAEFLREEFADAIAAGRLTVIEGDALAVELPDFTVSISNLPYGISSEILFRLLPRKRPLVATVQREFAERMVATSGSADYGRLSVTAGHYAACEIVETVPPEAFSPPPAVESAVVRATPRDPDYTVPEETFLALVRGVFTQRRKTLRNAIRNTTHITGIEQPERVVEAADEELLGRRAGELAPAEFAALAELAIEHGAAHK